MESTPWRTVVGGIFLSFLGFLMKDINFFHEYSLPSQHLVIGVLSARNHFSYRETIRKTWASELHQIPNSKLVFVLGETDCNIHPADRKSVHSCEEWKISENDAVSAGTETFTHLEVSRGPSHNMYDCNIGIGFKVMHSIVVSAFSIKSEIIKETHKQTVILQDAEEVLESVVVDSEMCIEHSGYCSVTLSSSLLLPKGFEGELLIQRNAADIDGICSSDFFDSWRNVHQANKWTGSSAVEFTFLRTNRNVIKEWNLLASCAVSLRFKITENDSLKRHIEEQNSRKENWKNYTEEINSRIMEEQNKNQDLLLLPHQDYYSNLPAKTMMFLKWVNEHFNSTFVMKVDDDTFVNIEELQTILAHKEEGNAWWAYFHYHRRVPIYGKSADAKYPGLTYPTFPSGAGYLLTGTLVHAVATMSHSLSPVYGGEDVSLGIWVTMAARDVKTFDVPCWLPHPRCKTTVLKTQLSEDQMISHWNSYLHGR